MFCEKIAMHILILIPLLAALAFLEVFIGGARLLYAIPGMLLVSLAAILTILPRKKSGGKANLAAIFSAIAFALYILIRNRFSEVEYIARLQFFIMAGCLMTYLIAAFIVTSPKERKLLFYFLIFLALLQLIPAVIQFSEGNHWMPLSWAQRRDTGWRASGFFISPNNFAGYMEVVALMATSFVVWGRAGWGSRTIMGYTAIASLGGVAISGSRGGYLSIAMGFGVLALLSLFAWGRMNERNSKLAIAAVSGFLILIVAGIWWAMQSSAVSERVGQINDPQNMRLLLWKAALEQFSLSPLWGTGGFSYLYFGRLFRDPSVQNDPIHVHNDYLQLLADYGIVGMALFILFLFLHLRSGISSYRQLVGKFSQPHQAQSDRLPLVIGSISAVAAYMVHSVVDFNMQLPLNALMMAMIFGILANPGGRPSSSSIKDRGDGIRRSLQWGLPIFGAAIIIYGYPMIRGEFMAEKSRVAMRDGQSKKSLEIALKGLKKSHDNPELYFDAGEAALRLSYAGDKDSTTLRRTAIEEFAAGLALFPCDSRLALKLAQAHAASRDYFKAVASLALAEKLDPNSAFVPAYKGLVEYSFGYLEDAKVAFNQAIDLGGEAVVVAQRGLELIEKDQEASEKLMLKNSKDDTEVTPEPVMTEDNSIPKTPKPTESNSDLIQAFPDDKIY